MSKQGRLSSFLSIINTIDCAKSYVIILNLHVMILNLHILCVVLIVIKGKKEIDSILKE